MPPIAIFLNGMSFIAPLSFVILTNTVEKILVRYVKFFILASFGVINLGVPFSKVIGLSTYISSPSNPPI